MTPARTALCLIALAFLAWGCSKAEQDRTAGEHEERAKAEGGEGHEGEHEEHGEHEGHDEHGKDEGHEEHGGHEGEAAGGGVELDSETIATSGIEVASAGPETLHIALDLPGEVVPNADRLAHIVPRFAGIARQVMKGLGDPVRQDEVLAIVESNESLSPYEVTSLISGTVIEKHITLGEFVRDDADIFIVADLSTVWVNVTVYARDLSRIRRGQRARISALGGSPQASGVIDYVGPVLGETTRAATARVVIPNAARAWRPGMFVTARVEMEQIIARVAVEDGALQRLESRDVVFVREGEAFVARPVVLGGTDGEWTEIVQGLAPGEEYVSRGSFILKSEMLKSQAGHEH